MSEAELIVSDTPEEMPDAPEPEAPEQDGDSEGGEEERAPEQRDRQQRTPEQYQEHVSNLTRALRAQERENRRYQERLDRMEETFHRMQSRQQQPQERPAQMPDPENDPIGALNFLMQERQRFVSEQEQRARQEQQYAEQARQFKQLANSVTELEEDFRQETPDYHDVVDPYLGHRVQMWMASGLSQEQAYNQVLAEVAAFSQTAMQARRNPAEAVYQAARQLGFGRQQQRQMHPNSLANLKAGQKMARNISGGNKTAGGPIGLKELANIQDDAKFAAAMEAWERQMMGA